ncbi:HK97 family phage prohead protease [Sphingobium sp. CFD-2]|uniref:HK97 family phage prohead protease n=1 Tax=Sphingobium sp. CFD-2 TaxID=2878542 RepID=UPI00214CB5BB|nr:HK97 family phage prohead protease [Sphingobium sp. CFD-2]
MQLDVSLRRLPIMEFKSFEAKEVAVRRAEFGLGEVKFVGDEGADARTFKGYGAVFGNIDSYGDVIQQGAFKKTLADAKKSGAWPAMLLQHGGWGISTEDLTPIGIWTELSEDDNGLLVTGKLAETARGNEAYGLLKMTPRPALNGLSIGYRARKFTMGTKPEEPRRTLHEVELVEVSLVTFPANPKARISSVKSGQGLGVREAEKALREAGFSSNEAKAILAKGFGAIDHREGDGCDPARLNDATARALRAMGI